VSVETPPPPSQPTPTAAPDRRRAAALHAPARGARAALGASSRGRRAVVDASRRRVNTPLYRNGYSLVASSALTSALGLIYWVVAARAYSIVAVGVGSALISVSTTIANLAHLNLKSGLNRFLPRAGRSTMRLVTYSYGIAVAVAGLASLAFIAGIGLWSSQLDFLRTRPLIGIGFVLATMAWTIFVLEDNVLTGIRKAHWVPVENLTYSILKLAALPALVIVTDHLGTFVSWMGTLPPVILAVNLLLFRRLLPRHARATEDHQEDFGARDVARYVAADFAAYTALTATIGLLPVVVLSVLGAKANAYYFITWSIAYGLYLIPSSMGMSMISESVTDPKRLADYDRQVLMEAAKLLVPCVLIIGIAAPWLLAALGHGYSHGATTLLRLLVVSALPWSVFVNYTNTARVRRRMHIVVRTTFLLFGLVLAIGLPLMGPLGVDGLGVGWLSAQTIVAAGILLRRPLARLRTDSGSWSSARQGLRRLAGAVLGGLIAVLAAVRNRWRHLWRPRINASVRAVLAELSRDERWVVQSAVPALNDVGISRVGPRDAPPAAIVKCARGTAGRGSLSAQARALSALEEMPELARWRGLIPQTIAGGGSRSGAYLIESCLPGATMQAYLRDGAEPGELLAAAATAITPLHLATLSAERFDAARMAELVDDPLARLESVVARHRNGAARAQLEGLRRELHSLAGRELQTSWVHGDLSPGNLLLSPSGRVTGIVDWERGRAHGLPQLDLLQLLISTRAAVEGAELGRVAAELRRDGGWRPHERQVAEALGTGDCPLPIETLVALTWLQHVSANLEKSPRYAHSPLWIRRNVDPVLETFTPLPIAPAPSETPTPPTPAQAASMTGTAATASATGLRMPLGRGVLTRGRASSIPRATIAALGGLGLAAGLWAISLGHIDPRAMTNLGLVSVLPMTFALALLVLSAGFVTLVHRWATPPWVLVAYLLLLVLIIHGTPQLVYDTVRYSWTYKHVGIVDYILRHHAVNRDLPAKFLNIYQVWPGFFTVVALMAKLAGLHTVLGVAGWGPVVNNVMYLPALAFLFGGLTRDRRLVWLSCWIFYIADWVGQDYFSPQGFAFLLYLLLIGVVLRWLRPHAREVGPGRPAALWLSALLIAAIVVTHALTAVMVCLALTALVLTRVSNARRLVPIAVAMTAGWDLTFAWPYTGPNLSGTLSSIHLPWETTSANLANFSLLSADQALVANVSRMLSVLVVGVAAAGAVRLLRAGRLDRGVAVLTVSPVLLFAAGNYDGEMLFRIYLFAVPFLAFLAANALTGVPRLVRIPFSLGVVLAILGLFAVAYYGDERANYFTPQEVTAARWVDTHVPTGSLVIPATSCDDLDTEYIERFTCVPFALQPASDRARILANPVKVLSGWMSNPAYHGGYVFLSRSQAISIQENGGLPQGALAVVERKLRTAPSLRVVFANRDAVVVTLRTTTATTQGRPR
jgi:hypothetical protein